MTEQVQTPVVVAEPVKKGFLKTLPYGKIALYSLAAVGAAFIAVKVGGALSTDEVTDVIEPVAAIVTD